MPESDEITVRRILVALDASPFGLEALEAAALLAAELRAELQAMFVEDINLLRLAGLPFACEIAYSSATQRQLDLTRMERALQADADQIRRALATACDQVRVEWSFSVTRGHVTRMPLAAASDTDVLIIGREGSAAASVLPGKRAQDRPIVVVFDGTESGQHALETAAKLTRRKAHQMLVVLADSSTGRRDELRRQCGEWFKSQHLVASCQQQAVSDAASLVRAARQCQARLVLINRDSHLGDEQTIETLVNQLDCPVGLVR